MNLTKFSNSKIGAFLIIIPFIKPASEITGRFNMVFNIWKLIAISIILCVCVINKIKITKPVVSILLIQIIYFVSTFLNAADIKSAMVQMISNIGICLYLVYLYQESEQLAVENFMYPTVAMAILVACTMFLYYPNGMYQVADASFTEKSNYLWGFDNTSGILFISTIFFLAIYSLYINKKIIYIFSLCIMTFFFAAFFYVKAITTFLMIFLIIFVYVLTIYRRIQIHILQPSIIIPVIVFCFIFIILFNKYFTGMWNYLKHIDKYYSVKARFNFFEREFYFISKSPILGCGIEKKAISAVKIYIDHPHNYFMDLLYRGGALAVAFMGYFFYQMIKKGNIKDSISLITSACLLAIMIDVMLDYYNELCLFYPHMLLSFFMLKERKHILKGEQIDSGIPLRKNSSINKEEV